MIDSLFILDYIIFKGEFEIIFFYEFLFFVDFQWLLDSPTIFLLFASKIQLLIFDISRPLLKIWKIFTSP